MIAIPCLRKQSKMSWRNEKSEVALVGNFDTMQASFSGGR